MRLLSNFWSIAGATTCILLAADDCITTEAFAPPPSRRRRQSCFNRQQQQQHQQQQQSIESTTTTTPPPHVVGRLQQQQQQQESSSSSSSSTTTTTNDALVEFQDKATTFAENAWESIQYRSGLFTKASKDYGFKQSMAITIAGDDYDSEQVQDEIRSIVNSNPCVMFVWEASPSCKQAVKAFDTMGVDVTVKIVRLDNPWSEGNKMRAELGKMTGKSSVPSIWIGGTYIGGYDAGVSDEAPGLVTLAFQGTLRKKLMDAGAIP